jgi:Uma2 family endonuclease
MQGIAIPLLRDGDRLDASEYERRYDAMPDLKKCELIRGVVYMGSPVRDKQHGEPHAHLGGWLGSYFVSTPIVAGGNNSTIRLDDENRPQPDLLLRLRPEHGGQCRRDADGYLVGAPELIIEVADQTEALDTGIKREIYEESGVREYIVWRVERDLIEWWIRRESCFEALPADEAGIFRSETFPGLWLDSAAMRRGDLARVLAVLQEGLMSPAHRAFIGG